MPRQTRCPDAQQDAQTNKMPRCPARCPDKQDAQMPRLPVQIDPYQHINPRDAKEAECPWFARGFCKHGAQCKRRHAVKVICINYMIGFCPDGPDCDYEHPKFELPMMDMSYVVRCHYCQELGHKSDVCPSNPHAKNRPDYKPEDSDRHSHRTGMPISKSFQENQPKMEHSGQDDNEHKIYTIPTTADEQPVEVAHANPEKRVRYNDYDGDQNQNHNRGFNSNPNGKFRRPYEKRLEDGTVVRDLSHIVCFKCLEKGHYANSCTIPKGQAGPGYMNNKKFKFEVPEDDNKIMKPWQ